jgi:hypothetical protein
MITAKDGKTRPPPDDASQLEDAASFPSDQDTATIAPLPPITLISSLSTDSGVGEQDQNVDTSATAYTDLILGDETWANAIRQNSELDGFENGNSGLPESDIEWTEWTGEVDLTSTTSIGSKIWTKCVLISRHWTPFSPIPLRCLFCEHRQNTSVFRLPIP